MGCSPYKYRTIKSLQNFSFSIILTHAMSELLRRRQCRLFNIKLALLFKMGPLSQPADWAFSSNKLSSISFRLRYFATFRNIIEDHNIKHLRQKTFVPFFNWSWLQFSRWCQRLVWSNYEVRRGESQNITNSTLLTLLLLNLQLSFRLAFTEPNVGSKMAKIFQYLNIPNKKLPLYLPCSMGIIKEIRGRERKIDWNILELNDLCLSVSDPTKYTCWGFRV